MPRNFLLALAYSLALAAAAQPTWRFPIAFEDGIGARDTIWMVYDTSATTGSDFTPQVDYALGEGGVNINPSVFNVWTWNWDGDSTKTHAYPYTQFPNFDGTTIDAINWTPPMTITWDSSLFHAPYLPYSQGHFGMAVLNSIAFSQFDQGPGFGLYNMLTDNSVTVDFLSNYLFSMGVYFGPVDDTGIAAAVAADGPLRIWPNPAQTILHIQTASTLDDVRIMDLSGRIVKSINELSNAGTVDIASLSPGTYILLARSGKSQVYHGKFQKVD